ncbi:choice-of-anchor M domain-containing protein [Streptomyces johnsoniae]|uniref:Choice-of-anchor M domain-containing protein n=1 Tax=Streptomyces johnsoniae TaxID=3075532 RepID=A0ABU2S4M1_9ACTN|nr:choice-of-anchor M domain-containing protein [Streptomyces sp. DSM 41886]MDT0443015.1 choice-of-anchor M domain-containing protein [Streptomyces sp. DSM 41886]
MTSRLIRRSVACLATVMVATTAITSQSTPALAAEGPAPDPKEYRVLQDLHTDAVATFLDDTTFDLGSKADVPEGTGTRFAADELWFHVDDDSATTVPEGFEFIAPEGAPVWLATEANPGGNQLWPGFSTESVPAGAIDDDRTTFTLNEVEGPGDLEVFTTGGPGSVNRLWSSDENEDYASFDVGRTHMHANWAFTEAGTYHLTVEAGVSRSGEPVSASATYTFVVGQLPETAATGSTLTSSATEITVGESIDLTASVTPASVSGYLEFRAGGTVLGHEPVTDGQATLTTDALGLGNQRVTAHFVPEVTNLAEPSTSEPVAIDVTEPGGEPFRIDGLAASYQPGDELVADAVGVAAGEDQSFRWVIRPVGSASSGYVTGTGPQLVQAVSASDDGYEIKVQLLTGRTVEAETAWRPIAVEPVGEVPVLTPADEGPVHAGNTFELELSGREAAEGETLELVKRLDSPWFDAANGQSTVTFPEPDRVAVTSTITGEAEYAVRVIRDGLAIAQSAPVTVEINEREVLFEGLRSLYREGATLQVNASVYPELEGATYSWRMPYDTVLKEGTGPEALLFEKTMTMADDGQWLHFVMTRGDVTISEAVQLRVTDAPAEEQILAFANLADHYHQGGAIDFSLIADPPMSDGDTVDWEWRWPGTEEWSPLPDTSGLEHVLVAEQALDGVEVRATLTFGDDAASPITADPVTVYVDDHGAPPRQTVTVAGETAYAPGDTATLTAEVEPGTVLTGYQWFEKAPDAEEAVAIPGATGPEYTFTTAAEQDGHEFSAAVVTPTGEVAYGPAAPVTLTVAR